MELPAISDSLSLSESLDSSEVSLLSLSLLGSFVSCLAEDVEFDITESLFFKCGKLPIDEGGLETDVGRLSKSK